MKEPLTHFVEKHSFDISNIERIVCGLKYSAVILKNGNIGVCSNLFKTVYVKIDDLKTVDLSNIKHRIILNAYYNGLLNYENNYNKTVDIFDEIDFKSYKNIIMIGLFKPLLKSFKKKKINISVFDLIKENRELISIDKEMNYINKADSIILSATTISNRTFMNIINNTQENCDIFLLGPSSIMNEDMLSYKNIKGIFGSIFKKNDERVLDVIEKGYGTRKFLRFGKKVCLKR